MFHESDLYETEVERYSRQIIVPGIGIEGQKMLRKKRVLIVGCGGLGCPVIMYLSTCGLVNIGIVDHDTIEIHNLQRQVLFKEKDLKRYKVKVAEENIKEMNNTVNVVAYKTRIDKSNVENIIKDYDIIVDCTDNIETRYCLSDACKLLKKDFICSSVLRWEGHLYVLPYTGPCYRCIYPVMKKSTTRCDESGIVGPVCGLFGSLVGLELIKLVMEASSTKMIYYNGYTNLYHNIKLRDKKCDYCTNQKTSLEIKQPETNTTCPDKIDLESDVPEISWSEILSCKEQFVIIDVRSNLHFRMFRIKESLNYPLNEIEKNISEISKIQKNIAVTCKKGITSKRAVRILEKYNIDAVSITGGLDEYKNQFLQN
ncbi:Adenylyltransferase and sulfurtransferase MOCS3 [Nosema granulosis]|uniref:Adenylyltransferase and sulfurtransferase MOCS3 n=1 Tax=Nosema granulosis TaxID=83296 RepID=A0A9P6KZB1_9MICR|nr:Adenylyltransferase and sulfurtransferase MOCS3 [Nosema granulosis]